MALARIHYTLTNHSTDQQSARPTDKLLYRNEREKFHWKKNQKIWYNICPFGLSVYMCVLQQHTFLMLRVNRIFYANYFCPNKVTERKRFCSITLQYRISNTTENAKHIKANEEIETLAKSLTLIFFSKFHTRWNLNVDDYTLSHCKRTVVLKALLYGK